jgi:hypothetical protein
MVMPQNPSEPVQPDGSSGDLAALLDTFPAAPEAAPSAPAATEDLVALVKSLEQSTRRTQGQVRSVETRLEAQLQDLRNAVMGLTAALQQQASAPSPPSSLLNLQDIDDPQLAKVAQFLDQMARKVTTLEAQLVQGQQREQQNQIRELNLQFVKQAWAAAGVPMSPADEQALRSMPGDIWNAGLALLAERRPKVLDEQAIRQIRIETLKQAGLWSEERQGPVGSGADLDALQNLNRRLARGEISREDFLRETERLGLGNM